MTYHKNAAEILHQITANKNAQRFRFGLLDKYRVSWCLAINKRNQQCSTMLNTNAHNDISTSRLFAFSSNFTHLTSLVKLGIINENIKTGRNIQSIHHN